MGVHQNDIAYQERKDKENREFIADVKRYLGADLDEISALLLDDLDTRSLRMWVANGGSPSRVYVPNPSKDIVEAVCRQGGRGYLGMLQDLLQDEDHIMVPPQACYLDFCGFWHTQADAVKTLIRKYCAKVPRMVLTLTTCLREGHYIHERTVLSALQKWAEPWGKILLVRSYNTSTMNKATYLFERETLKEWKVGDVLYQKRSTWPEFRKETREVWIRGIVVRIRPSAKREQVLVEWPIMDCTSYHSFEKAPWNEGAMATPPPGSIVI